MIPRGFPASKGEGVWREEGEAEIAAYEALQNYSALFVG